MFGIGVIELAVLAVVALVFVGPQRIPELAKQMGRFFVHIKRATHDVRSTVDDIMRESEAEIIREERQKLTKLLTGEGMAVDVSDSPPAAIAENTRASGHDQDSGDDIADDPEQKTPPSSS